MKLGIVEVVAPNIQGSQISALVVGYVVSMVFSSLFWSVHTCITLVKVAQRHGSLRELMPAFRDELVESFQSWSRSISGNREEVLRPNTAPVVSPVSPVMVPQVVAQVPGAGVERVVENNVDGNLRDEIPVSDAEVDQEPFSLLTAFCQTLKVCFMLIIDMALLPYVSLAPRFFL